MGTTAIDIMQSAQITTLQNDVAELTTKLNAVVADIATLKDKISSGYTASQTTGGGSSTDAILKRLSDLDDDYKQLSDHYQQHVINTYNHATYGHGTGGRTGNRGGGGSIGVSTARYIDIDSPTSTSTNASTTGVYTPESKQVITVTDASATRARKAARDAINRIRGT